MTDHQRHIDLLINLIAGVDALVLEGEQIGRDFPDATADNAVRMLGQASSALRRAVEKATTRIEREQAKEERLSEWRAADSERRDQRQYDEMTHIIAKARGVPLAEAQRIRDEAAAESRRVAAKGSIEQQLADLEDPHG